MSDIGLIIKIDEEDYKSMKHNVVTDNPLCPLGQKEIVTKIANGVLLPEGSRLMNADAFINSLKGIEKLHIDDELRNSILDAVNDNVLVRGVI